MLSCRFRMFLAAALTLGLASVTWAGPWPQYRGPQGNGSTSERINTQWSGATPRVVWRIGVGSSLGSFVTGDGKLFVLAQQGENEACQALNPADGHRLWSTDLGRTIFDQSGGDGPRSTPAFNDGRVYVYGTYQVLTCLNAADGKVIWSHDVNKEFGGVELGWGSAASPVVEGDLVLVCCGGKNQSLVAFNKKTGELVWKGQSDAPTHASPVAATILGIRQVIFFTQKGLVSVKPETGQVFWRQAFPYNTSTAASPVVCGEDIVYCSAGYGVGSGAYKISKSGDKFASREMWFTHKSRLVNHWSTPVYKDGYLYGLFGFKEFKTEPLKCLDVKTGREVWSHDGFGQGEVILVNGNLLAQTDYGDLVLVNAAPNGYHELARCHPFDGKPKCWTDPAVANGRIYARSQQGGVCLDVAPLTAASAMK